MVRLRQIVNFIPFNNLCLYQLINIMCNYVFNFLLNYKNQGINQHVKIFDVITTDKEKKAKYMAGALAILNSVSSTVVKATEGQYSPPTVSVRTLIIIYDMNRIIFY